MRQRSRRANSSDAALFLVLGEGEMGLGRKGRFSSEFWIGRGCRRCGEEFAFLAEFLIERRGGRRWGGEDVSRHVFDLG